jgi:acyl carrier protein
MKGENAEDFAKTEQGILAWIVARVAESCGVSPEDIEAERPLTDYMFDSIDVLEANVELADWLGIKVPSTMLWVPPSMVDAARQIRELAADGEKE